MPKVAVTTIAEGQVEGSSDYHREGFWLKVTVTISAKASEGNSDVLRNGFWLKVAVTTTPKGRVKGNSDQLSDERNKTNGK